MKSIGHPFEINNQAEGSSSNTESVEPDSPLETKQLPAIQGDFDYIAETGLISAVPLEVEGRDAADSQDASRTMDETHLAPTSLRQAKDHLDKMPSVLIIEDTVELAEVITATLERMDMETAHESRGDKALERFYQMNPDVVLLDISLPDMPGWKILDAIKEQSDAGGKMPIVIVITAYDDPANRLVGKLQGVYTYLIKPFTSDEIERTVTEAIRSSTL